MSRWLVEKRLAQSSQRIRRLRAELEVLDEQLLVLADEASDARLRAVVSETPMAHHADNEAQRQVEAMNRQRNHLVEAIGELERSQDELLDRLVDGVA